MKKIILFAGIIFSLLLASCSNDVNDFGTTTSEQLQAKQQAITTSQITIPIFIQQYQTMFT